MSEPGTLYNFWATKKDSDGHHLEALTAQELQWYEDHYKKKGFKVTWNFSTFGEGIYE